jgi:DNA polymerase III delta subunit
LSAEWSKFPWEGVRLVISAGKVDRRRAFYKTLEKIGTVEEFAALDPEKDRDWAVKAESIVATSFKDLGKTISDQGMAALVSAVGPNIGLLQAESLKIATYVGERAEVDAEDIEAVAIRNKQAKAFALGDAVGDRSLPRVLQTLEEELWQMKFDRERSVIGLLYGLVSKMRSMLLMKELVAEGLMRPSEQYSSFKQELARLPADRLPTDRRFNPAMTHPYVLFSALRQSANYSREELVDAMERLLECNQQLLSTTQQDDALILQRVLVDIVGARMGRSAGRTAEL